MLVITRKLEEEIVIGDSIVVKVIRINRGQVLLGITADKDIPVHRREIQNLRDAELKKQEQENLQEYLNNNAEVPTSS